MSLSFSNAKTSYTATSSLIYSIGFTYENQSEVKVRTQLASGAYQEVTNWSFLGTTSIQFTSTPPTTFEIYRVTDISRSYGTPGYAVFRAGSQLNAGDLNKNFELLRRGIEENNATLSGLLFEDNQYFDDVYVNATGDKMTGDLRIGTSSLNKITLRSDGSADFQGKLTSYTTLSSDGTQVLTTKGYVDASVAAVPGTNLAYDGATRLLSSSTGTDVTLPEVTAGGDSGLLTGADKTKLDGIESGATADQTDAEIKTAYENNADTNAFTDAEKTKLAGIETAATADQTGAEIKALYEVEANAFTDAQFTKLAGIETAATADQTDAEIKTAYENNADTNAFTDAEKTKLSGIAAGAEVNTVTSVNTATGAVVLDADDIDDTSTAHKFVTASDVTALGTLSSDLAGKADLSGGKLDTSQLPDIAISEYKGAVANQTAMLAVTGEKGDWVTRSDDGKVYVITGTDPSVIGGWTALSYPVSTNTNLSYASSTRILSSSTGTDATLPEVVAAGDSGLMTGADKTKLDGIESGATADQTAAEILTAIKTVDGATSGLDSDLLDGQHGSHYLDYNNFTNTPTIPTNNNQLTNGAGYITSADGGNAGTLDGLDSTQFVRSDAADTVTGTITFSGTSSAPFRLSASNANGSWDAVTFQATTEWGDASSYGVLGGDGTEGIMLRKPHVVWNSSHSAADIRLGKSGGTGSGGWVNIGIKGSNVGFIGYQDSNVLTWDASGNLANNGDNYITFGPNSTWSSYLRIGGNGYQGGSAVANIATTNGNLHIDAATSSVTYLNYYSGTGGIAFGNGASGIVAWMGPDGDLWKGNSDNSGSKYWHAGNDGSGSGLDADTVDGIQASNFVRADASDTMNGQLTINTGDDQHLILKGSSNPYIRFQEGTTNKAYIQWHAAGYLYLRNQEDSSGIRIRDDFEFTPDGTSFYNIWHANNDGSGSGLDADTVDGIQGSQILRSDVDDAASGTMTFNGRVNIRGHIDLSDSENLDFGSSDDVRVYYNGSNNWLYWNFRSSNGIIFQDNGTSKIILEDSGIFRPNSSNTGTIGTSSHYWDNGFFHQFNVSGTINVRGAIDLADNDILRLGSSDDVEFFCNGSHMYTDLNSGIGNWYIRDGSTTRFTFDDAGHFTASGNVTAYSDITLKKNIEVIPNALEKVSAIRGVTYERKDNEELGRQAGVIAQEVEKVLPEVVSTDEEGIKSVAYGNLVGLLIEAVKELKAEVEILKSESN